MSGNAKDRERCDGCMFWLNVGYEIGTCRRFPPQPHPGGETMRPLTRRDDWCGEFIVAKVAT